MVQSLSREELMYTNALYDNYIEDWELYGLSYEGGRRYVETVLTKNEMESDDNYTERLRGGICYNYCSSIIDLYNFYLTEKEPVRYLYGLDKDPQWQAFLLDSDLAGTNYDAMINSCQKIASIYGSIGILIDKTSTEFTNKKEELEAGVYPYISVYTLENILDWKFERNKISNRPELTYIKFRDDNDNYRIWTKTQWQVWYADSSDEGAKPELIATGVNPLAEIPFIWMPNIRNFKYPYLGISDLKEVSYITGSIVRNVSMGDECIKMAGFPMFRKPMMREDQEDTDDVVGIRAVQQFDPELGEAGKPDWLESKILEPIQSILDWTDRKSDEIYRISHLLGIQGQRKSNVVNSGVALRYEFQQLNSVLSQKSVNLCEAEINIIKYWLMWQGRMDLFPKIEIKRSKTFSIDDLSIDLNNSFASMQNIVSDHFRAKMMLSVSKKMLPDLEDQDFDIIEKELTDNIKAGRLPQEYQINGNLIKTADQSSPVNRDIDSYNDINLPKDPIDAKANSNT